MAASMMAGCKHDGGLQGESGDLSALFVQKARIYIHSSTRARCARRFIARIFFRGCACKRHASACARTRRAGTACARAEWVLRLCHSVRDCARVCACVRSRAFACVRACVRACERACARLCGCALAYGCLLACLLACVRACVRARALVWARVGVRACVHACACVRVRARACACVRVRARACPCCVCRACVHASASAICVLRAHVVGLHALGRSRRAASCAQSQKAVRESAGCASRGTRVAGWREAVGDPEGQKRCRA